MKFKIGQVVHHKMFDYRGVIFGAHIAFKGSDTWYEQVAKSRPPKDKPWYSVLVHGSAQTTYVAERNLEIEEGALAIEHPVGMATYLSFRARLQRPESASAPIHSASGTFNSSGFINPVRIGIIRGW